MSTTCTTCLALCITYCPCTSCTTRYPCTPCLLLVQLVSSLSLVHFVSHCNVQLCACYNPLTQQAGNSNQNTISRTQAHTAHRHTGTHPLSLSMKLIGHDEGHQHIVVTYKRVSRAICPSIRHSHLAINNQLYDG